LGYDGSGTATGPATGPATGVLPGADRDTRSSQDVPEIAVGRRFEGFS
jgi:hypothetical protein